DLRSRVRRDVAAEVLDDDAAARARHDVVSYVHPRVVGDAQRLSERAEEVVDLVGVDAAVAVARAARPVEGGEPDAHLADVLDDVVFDDGVRAAEAVAVD